MAGGVAAAERGFCCVTNVSRLLTTRRCRTRFSSLRSLWFWTHISLLISAGVCACVGVCVCVFVALGLNRRYFGVSPKPKPSPKRLLLLTTVRLAVEFLLFFPFSLSVGLSFSLSLFLSSFFGSHETMLRTLSHRCNTMFVIDSISCTEKKISISRRIQSAKLAMAAWIWPRTRFQGLES